MTIIDTTPNKPGHFIDALWVVISRDDQGEGLCSAPIPGRPEMTIPLVASDEARLGNIIEFGKMLAKLAPDRKLTLIRLDRRSVIGTIDANGLKRISG